LRRNRPLLGAILVVALVATWIDRPCLAQVAATASSGISYTVEDVWSDGTYNAFTDLTRFDGNWYLVFRTASQHGIPPVGQAGGDIRVLESTNGQTWTTAAVLSGSGDLRDPKISVTPSNQLMINSGDFPQSGTQPVQSVAWFSSNGTNWGNETPVGDDDYWLWRVVWYNGVGYGISYGATTGPLAQITTRLSTTTNGVNYTTTVPQLNSTGQFANESGLTFLPNGTAVVVTRRDGEATDSVGIATGNYTNWTFTSSNIKVESPDLLTLPDGRIVCAGRFYASTTPDIMYTGLGWVDPTTGTITPFLTLPNSYAADTGYPGVYWYNNQLWVSYYSIFTGSTKIYVGQVTIPAASWSSALSGSWSTAGNWGGAAPGAVGAIVAINAPTTTPLTVTLDRPQTVGTLELGNSGNTSVGYTLSGSGTSTLTLDNSGSGTTISIAGGSHIIDAPAILADNLLVSGSGTLEFSASSSITETNGKRSLTINGAGVTLILSGSDTYSGGTVVTAGTLVLESDSALADGTSLTVGAGGGQLFDPAVAADSLAIPGEQTIPPVPEPGTLALLMASLLMACGAWCRMCRVDQR
jgi:autotransporter-associated beta strand protein